jgi:hypothetical protein
MTEGDRAEVLLFVSRMAEPIGGWEFSFDATYGSGEWPGRRRGTRRDRRDGLLTLRGYRRGFDADDALCCFGKFMKRVCPHISWFASAEPNPDYSRLNPGFHIHATLADAENEYRAGIAKLWTEENGYCKIKPIRSTLSCMSYCTKHLVRRGSIYSWEINNPVIWDAQTKAQSNLS